MIYVFQSIDHVIFHQISNFLRIVNCNSPFSLSKRKYQVLHLCLLFIDKLIIAGYFTILSHIVVVVVGWDHKNE